jgi:hypothetical protein
MFAVSSNRPIRLMTVAVLLDVYAHPCQISHPANRLWWNETASQQAVLQKLGNAPCIDPIRLLALQGVYGGGIHQCQLKLVLTAFEHIPHWYPVNAGRFHRHLPDLSFFEPLAKPFQILRESPEQSFFHLEMTAFNSAAQTNADRLFMYIHSSATAVK